MLETIKDVLFIDWPGVTVVSRGGRLYVRVQGEFTEIELSVRLIIASGFGFVVTSDAMVACVRRHIEIIITDVTQAFTAIFVPYPQGNASRAGLAVRTRQFAALADRGKAVKIAKDIVRRKIMAEGHDKPVQAAFLADFAACKTTATIRHVEAKAAQEWWRKWKDFELAFARGFSPPKQWRVFKTRYIGRAQGKSGELARQFTPRFAETPLQAMHNFVVSIAVARITRVIAARGLDPCFGFLHDGRKPGRFSLAWDAIEVLRQRLAEAVFDFAASREFRQADFAQQDGVVRLSSRIARECAAIAYQAAPLTAYVQAVRKIESLL